jgi:peptidoglycan/LPS O-acetylase OafA/YrhL
MQLNDLPDVPVTRFDGVDTLRGLSILAVVLLHAHLRMFFAGHSIEPLMPRWLFEVLFTNGNNGVTVFFAVSGFLITFTSLRRFGSLARMRAATFYRVRFARIAPLLLLTLTILSLLHLMHAEGFRIPSSRGSLSQALFSALTFHLNWLEARRGFLPANWDVLWSLSVEEMFYLFFPLVCLLFLRWRRGTLLFVLALVLFIGMGPFARTVWTTNEIWQEKSYLGGMDGIALGCLTALLVERLQRDRVQIRTRLLIAIQFAGAFLMGLIIAWPHWHWMLFVGRTGIDGIVLALGTCCFMFGSVLSGRVGKPWSEPIRWIGRRSYEIYLTHEFVVVWMTLLYVKLHRGPVLMWIAAMVALSVVIGAWVARLFSEPMNRRLRGARIASNQTEPAEQMA